MFPQKYLGLLLIKNHMFFMLQFTFYSNNSESCIFLEDQ
jgi:hypothetical protein